MVLADIIIIITFTSSALEDLRKQSLYEVFTCSQGNLEAKGDQNN